jgi:hypothetical protein
MPAAGISRISNTYAGYSIGSAVVWAVILAVGHRRLDSETWKTLRLGCAGWWSGWTSATIARAGYPPPKQLSPDAERRLAIGSLALVALGLLSVLRLMVAGKRSAESQPHPS